jgi:hypothetical protein
MTREQILGCWLGKAVPSELPSSTPMRTPWESGA